MNLTELIILAAGLSMDAFAVSICKGLSLQKVRIRHMIIAGLWFGGFQALMPVIGYYLGSLFTDFVSSYSHWIACILLMFIGISMIKEAFSSEENTSPQMDPKSMLLLAVATSIDALAVGVSFAFLNTNIFSAASIIGITTFLFSAAGVKIGSIFGDRYKSKAEIIGGIILILIGVKIVLTGCGVIG